jgi:methyl-accepting chemotaxis protein
MNPIATTAIVGGLATSVVIPSIGKAIKAFSTTPTAPKLALGSIPAPIIYITHQVMTSVFENQKWSTNKQLNIYAIYVCDLAAGLSSTAVIAMVTETELVDSLGITALSICAILIVLGVQSFFKKEDQLKQNEKLLVKIQDRIGKLETPPADDGAPPTPPSNKALKEQVTLLATQFQELNGKTQHDSQKLRDALANLDNLVTRLSKKCENTEEIRAEIEAQQNALAELNKALNVVGEKANQVPLLRSEMGRMANQMTGNGAPVSTTSTPQQPNIRVASTADDEDRDSIWSPVKKGFGYIFSSNHNPTSSAFSTPVKK